MSESTSQNEELQTAVREAGEWKVKALAYQKAAEQLKEKAQTLKERAQLALDNNKDLTVSIRQLHKRAQELQGLAQRLAAERDDLGKRLEDSDAERRKHLAAKNGGKHQALSTNH